MFLLPMWAIWLILCGIFFIVEIFTISFIYLWPGIGAFLALIVTALGFDFKVQVSVFAISSILLIFFTKPLVKKFFKVNDTAMMNNKSVIGKNGIVLKTVNNLEGSGQVKVSGEIWSAMSTDDEIIEEGVTIVVNSINGVKLSVKKV